MELRLKNIYEAKIDDLEIFEEAVKDFGLNYCKGNTRLKRNKELAIEAIKQYPWTLIHLPKELLEDEDVQKEIKKDNSYLFDKYINPTDAFLNENIANNIRVQLEEVRSLLEKEEEYESYESYVRPENIRGKENGKER